jgi:hypothetical protein
MANTRIKVLFTMGFAVHAHEDNIAVYLHWDLLYSCMFVVYFHLRIFHNFYNIHMKHS